MATDVARCPMCAAAVDLGTGFWARLWSGHRKVRCRNCRKLVSPHDARLMGQAFGYWMHQLHTRLAQAYQSLPLLDNTSAITAMGPGVSIEMVRPVASLEALTHFVTQLFRPILMDRAQGRNVELEVVTLGASGKPQAVGIIGRTSVESGERPFDLLVTRVGGERFLVHVPAEPSLRLREALRQQRYGTPARSGNPAHSSAPPSAPAITP